MFDKRPKNNFAQFFFSEMLLLLRYFVFSEILYPFPSLIFLANKHEDKFINNDKLLKFITSSLKIVFFKLKYVLFMISFSDIQS